MRQRGRSHLVDAGTLLFVLFFAAGCVEFLPPMGVAQATPVIETAVEGPALVRLAVSSAAEGYVAALVRAYSRQNPQVAFDITIASPAAALEMLASGEAEAAFTTRRPGEELSAPLHLYPTPTPVPNGEAGNRRNGNGVRVEGDATVPSEPGAEEPAPELVVEALARDGIVIIVHASHRIESLTTMQVAELFGGYVLDWERLGAGSGPTELVVQDASSTSRLLFHEEVLEDEPVSSAALLVPNDRAAVAYVGENAGAVSYAAAASLDGRVRVVAIADELSDRRVAERATFATQQEVVMAYLTTLSPEAETLVRFARGAQGRELARSHFAAP